uniref:unspecific monooxygenase n=2 Tax=Cnaphalocrocis medinalis TaxID=437488 RepID=C1LZ54_CNAME|nr:CYP6AE28 protein [Cnaphalocrocis medinalis]
MLPIYLILCVAVIYCLHRLATLKYNYWKKRNVPHPPPTPVLGNYGPYLLMQKYYGQVAQEIRQKYPNAPYIGAYYGTEPTLIVQDPELIKIITTKDFYYFNSREISEHTHKEVTTQNLFFTYGDQWKAVRQNMTPLFSSAKMRNMFPLIAKCSVSFQEHVDQETSSSDVIDVKSLMARYTMACIVSCAFGAEVDTLTPEGKDSQFVKIGKLIFLNSYLRGGLTVFRAIWPTLFYKLGLKNFPDEMTNFFKRFVTNVFEARKYTPTRRNDFVDLLLNLRQQKSIVADSLSNGKTGREDKVELPVTDDLLVSQCVLFFAAGFETSSTATSFLLYELSKKPEIQERVLQEVDAFLAKHDNKLTYDCVTELPYTQACIDESLRLYPALGVITREVMEEYTLPDGLVLEKGVRIHIPVYGLHYNPDHFPDPEEFRPERFEGSNRNNIKPHTYIPFGDGSRICIGLRFAKMQMLAGLISLLKKYRVEMTKDTPTKLDYDPRALVTIPLQSVNLKLVPREGWEKRIFVQ